MKASILGLALATAAFAGSSLYLWNQLDEERARSAQVEQTTRELNARIAELEQARTTVAQQRVASANGAVVGAFGSLSHALPEPSRTENPDHAPQPVWTVNRAEPTPAMQKMFRTQARARNKRLYADVSQAIGLSKQKADQLIDLLTEQQMLGMTGMQQFKDPAESQRHYQEMYRANETAISDLVGPDKAMALKEYQETLPARMEFEMYERQLADNDAALSESQRKQLLNVYVAERNRVPAPEYRTDVDPGEFHKATIAWKEDYERRVADEASRILNASQLATYNDIQQGQKEMREQFATSGMMLPNDVRTRPGIGANQNVITFTSATSGIAAGTIDNYGASQAVAVEKKP